MKKLAALMLAVLLLLTCVAAALADVYKDAGFIKKIPMKPKYTEEVDQHGTVEKLTYTTHAYALEEAAGKEILVEKELYVYLPYGYDPANSYNVLYTMHGAGEDERYWLSEERMGKGTLALLDRMFSRGEAEPTIIVTPTTNTGKLLAEDETVQGLRGSGPKNFWKELRNEVIPLIETKYSTYAGGDMSPESLAASREHRAFTGFSMGSVTTVNVMQHCLDIFAYFGNYSDVNVTAGIIPDGKFEEFFAAMESDEFKDLPIKFWYHGEGSADYALEGHLQFCEEIKTRMADRVTDGENYAYVEFKGGTHAYNCWLPHLYNCLLVFFK